MASPAHNQASSSVLLPQIDRNDLKALEAISSAAIGPTEAYFVVRGLFQRDKRSEILEASYEALRGVVFQFVAGRVVGEQLDQWADVILRIRQLFRSRSETIAERFTVLSDFLEQASRFAEYNPIEELRGRKHVRAILLILSSSDRPVERARILEATGLRDANLSRILGNLTAIGWVTKRASGREVLVDITPQGRRDGLGEQEVAPAGTGPFASPAALDILREIWGRSGASIAMSSGEAGIVACDAKFASLLGFTNPGALVGQSTALIRQRLGEMHTGSDEVAPDEIALADGSYHRVIEHSFGGVSLWVGNDVTPYKQRIEAYARREASLMAQVQELERRSALQEDTAYVNGALVADPTVGVYDLSAYLGAIRNDLLFPITAINNASHRLRNTMVHLAVTSDELIEQIDVVTHASETVRGALRDILFVSDPPRLAVSSFTPSSVVREVTDFLRYSGRSLDQALEVATDLDEEIETDEMLFRSTVRNAVSGVMQMTPSGGRIAIETFKVDDTVQLRVKSWGEPVNLETTSLTSIKTFNLCRHAVSRIGGMCDFESSGKGFVARISMPIMGGRATVGS